MRHPQKLAISKKIHIFLIYPHETWWKWLPDEMIIWPKVHEDRTKMWIFYKWEIFECVSFFIPQTLFGQRGPLLSHFKSNLSLWICFSSIYKIVNSLSVCSTNITYAPMLSCPSFLAWFAHQGYLWISYDEAKVNPTGSEV